MLQARYLIQSLENAVYLQIILCCPQVAVLVEYLEWNESVGSPLSLSSSLKVVPYGIINVQYRISPCQCSGSWSRRKRHWLAAIIIEVSRDKVDTCRQFHVQLRGARDSMAIGNDSQDNAAMKSCVVGPRNNCFIKVIVVF